MLEVQEAAKKEQLLKFSDLIPLILSSIYAVFFIILITFSLLFIYSKLNSDTITKPITVQSEIKK